MKVKKKPTNKRKKRKTILQGQKKKLKINWTMKDNLNVLKLMLFPNNIFTIFVDNTYCTAVYFVFFLLANFVEQLISVSWYMTIHCTFLFLSIIFLINFL